MSSRTFGSTAGAAPFCGAAERACSAFVCVCSDCTSFRRADACCSICPKRGCRSGARGSDSTPPYQSATRIAAGVVPPRSPAPNGKAMPGRPSGASEDGGSAIGGSSGEAAAIGGSCDGGDSGGGASDGDDPVIGSALAVSAACGSAGGGSPGAPERGGGPRGGEWAWWGGW